jgi:hypothetical protein
MKDQPVPAVVRCREPGRSPCCGGRCLSAPATYLVVGARPLSLSRCEGAVWDVSPRCRRDSDGLLASRDPGRPNKWAAQAFSGGTHSHPTRGGPRA